jgi:membrane-associated phospholipid phosphatase
MAYACSVLLLITLIACRLASIDIRGLSKLAIGIVFISAVVFTLAVYWHEKGKMHLRDATMTIPWVIVLAVIVPPLVLAIARLGMPLQDEHLARIDQVLGVNVPQITSWTSRHWLGTLINRTYPLLSPLLTVSIFLPALLGKVQNAQQFVMANLIAFFIGLPLFALVPAIGPWYGYHFAATSGQMDCQSAILLFRAPGHAISQLNAIICFPSFHVIWAIFCVAALWGFRLLRIPVALFSSMIVISTVTTGWHYVIDVLGGFVVAGLSLAIAKAFIQASNPYRPQLEVGAMR